MTTKKQHWRNDTFLKRAATIAVLDVICICMAYFCAIWVRYDFQLGAIPAQFKSIMAHTLPWWCLLTLAVFIAFRLYNSIWSFVSADELLRIIGAYLVLGVCELVWIYVQDERMPLSYYALGLLMSFCMTALLRFGYRLARIMRQNVAQMTTARHLENVMIIGAGEAGKALLTEFQTSAYIKSRVVCLIDDNPVKTHKRLSGVPIVGDRNAIVEAVEKYSIDRIIYAIPSSSAKTRKEILSICSTTGCQVQS